MSIAKLLNNRYRILRELGSGGFGETFLAEDTQMPSGRRCVIKQLKPVTANPQIFQTVKDRFAREAAILEELGEGNQQIPRLYAYFPENGQFYLVQEWIEGETLNKRMEHTGPLSESSLREILVSLLPVLEFVHSKHIVHRDIKPENIILRRTDEVPVLIDFGAVKETMGTVVNSSGNSTRSIVIGTPGFMPSEQAAGRPVYSSDLYSLGLTAIYLLTGKIPQELDTDPQTGEIIWRVHAPTISPTLAGILDRAIKSHPRDRFSSAREMLDAIAAPAYTPTPATLASPPPVAASQPPTTLSSPSDRPANSSPGMGDWQKATIIGGIIGIFTLLGLWITRPQPEPIISDSSENDTPNSPASPNPPENETPNSPPAPPTPQVPPQPVNPFNKSAYPKTSCGDRLPTDPYTYPVTFYPVFIYNSELNLQRVKAMFCEDAYPRFLENQNQQLIQVASFSTRERAEFFTELLRERFRSAAVGAPRLIEQMPE